MYSFSIVVIKNLYIQTSFMVAWSLFRVREGGGGGPVRGNNRVYVILSSGHPDWESLVLNS